ncbi:MAG TPA: GNAT family N-acetyltransferase [Acidimicrobiales bacterium]|nr:GNAT family N-acetyltransferase [Acidimicrobiales bacterium]
MDVKVEIVDPSRTYELRHRVLRPNRPFAETVNSTAVDEAFTFGLTEGEDPRILATATVYREEPPTACTPLTLLGSMHRAWHLRAVATEEHRRSEGLGKLVLDAIVDFITERESALLWCNARLRAQGFYTREGFSSCGEIFEVEEIGMHIIMYRTIERRPST